MAHVYATRKLGRPVDVDSAETRQRVLTEARKLFARAGYDATTNRAIAAAAGLTPGAIYHYVDSKAELYAAVYAEVQTRVYDAFEKSVVGQTTLATSFAGVLDAAVELSRQDPSLPAFIAGVASEAERHPELRDLLRPVFRRHVGFIGRLVTEARDRGELVGDISPQAVEDLLNAVLVGFARLSTSMGDSRRHAAAVDALKRFFAGTLLSQPAGRRSPVARAPR